MKGCCIGTLRGHDEDVLDIAFDYTGQRLLTASADGTARCYNSTTHSLLSKMQGHEGEISKVSIILCICRYMSYISFDVDNSLLTQK